MFRIGFFTNPWLLLGVVAMTLLQIGFTYLPFMNQVFETAPLKIRSWIVIIGVGLLVYGLAELEKSIRRWKEDKVLE
jgi:Ca2+-transporting ATPase